MPAAAAWWRWLFFLACLCCCWWWRAAAARHELSIVLLVRLFDDDEALENIGRLVEWIEYHRLLGVDHFYVFDNAQHAGERLDRHAVIGWYVQTGVVSYELIPYQRWTHALQLDVYHRAALRYALDTQLLAFLDMDEYLHLAGHATLPELVRAHQPDALSPDYNGAGYTAFVFACWFYNGHVQLDDADAEQLTIEAYRYREQQPLDHRSRSKYIAVARLIEPGRLGVHQPLIERRHLLLLSPAEAHFNHYWKQRKPSLDGAVYAPDLADRYGPLVRARIDAVSQAAGVPRADLRSKPFPLVPSQAHFDAARSSSLEPAYTFVLLLPCLLAAVLLFVLWRRRATTQQSTIARHRSPTAL